MPPGRLLRLIPEEGVGVTVAWVADVLASRGIRAAGRLQTVDAEPVAKGTGVFGEVTRLRLGYDTRPRTAPASLILKLGSRCPANRARALRFRLDSREVAFYRDVAATVDLRVPRCYWSDLDVDNQSSGLLLEDLGHLEAGDQLLGMTVDEALLAAERLARFHAQWWHAPWLQELTWMPTFGDALTRQLARLYRELWPSFVELHGDALPPGALELGERARDRFELLLGELCRPPVTIAHGDLRLDNLFFGAPSTVDDFAVVDWQLACRGRGAFDIAYLLGQNMGVEERRLHEMTVLASWHRALVAHGVSGYSFDDAVTDYRCSTLASLGWVVAGTGLDRTNESGRLVAGAQAVRSFTAALDLGAASLVPG